MEEDKKISQLSVADAIDGTELIPFAKNGDNGAVPASLLKGQQGEKGEKGDTGSQGPVGPKGDKGDGFTTEQADKLNALPSKEELDVELNKFVTSEPTDSVLEEIEPNIVTDALRKTKQTLSGAERNQALENLGNPEMKTFIDLWDSVCDPYGKYNTSTGFFELNEITDITYEEAIEIYKYKQIMPRPISIDESTFRTNILVSNALSEYDRVGNIHSLFRSSSIETIRISISTYGFRPSSSIPIIIRGRKLRKVLGVIDAISIPSDWLPLRDNNFPVLSDITIKNLKKNMNISAAPALSLESMQYMVTNAANTSAITITVHPAVYAKLTDTSNTDWNAVLTSAAAKNITFVTTE